MKPSIWIYGGVHDNPGSRRKFLEELAKKETAPHFVAVEWEESFFKRVAALRPQVEEGIRSRWDFLTPEDHHELSLALAWEGDAYAERFADTKPLWLETGFQEAYVKRHNGEKFPEHLANRLLTLLRDPCSPVFKFPDNTNPPPEPRSKDDLIDCVWKKAWSSADPLSSKDFERDKTWAKMICKRSSGLHSGWIAIVVGWAHADPEAEDQRLRGLLLSKSFSVNSVCLVPKPPR